MMRKIIVCLLVLLCMTAEALAGELQIIDKPVVWSAYREQLIREYAQKHYGLDQVYITPQAVVVHWTASNTWESAYNHFYHEARGDGTLNVASHFLVSREGQVYRLTPETALNRHIIGYNWCAIGIENVGGVGGVEDLTAAQLEANVDLIRYLQEKYPTIRYVFGHYQQDMARSSGLYRENVAGYRSEKIDPGHSFMAALREHLQGSGITFYEE
ncbi:putative N-acetylmuramoyl-L-alanine amidase [Selenomonas ruminantium subsp. lactilytica TAM6421]|uniref:N-acetylmuramoyl-L-alanine amidase n=1 Tax=Selenomonas ruminantium subsp. lactilytica (strain NBRC 103574 / TAM6421) TaxID=927704 RepID=I0GNU1_SELRL|nr:peptidoglycan recognition family protein [Selenomonas ruminantium]BAL82428.1 putative N-acetylmuramoyl-L-alanine amidase [Selenomonas ruminantium subsp. lactilytica TAM6421]